MKPLPKKDPPEVGGGVVGPCTDPPMLPTWPQPFPPHDPIPFPDGGPYPGPYDPSPQTL